MSKQVREMSAELKSRQGDLRDRVDLARRLLAEWSARYLELRDKAERGRLGWLAALPTEPLQARHPLPETGASFTVIATDGSQIEPDRHSPAVYYLINVGSVLLRYGPGASSRMGSQARLCYRDEDMVIRHGSEEFPVQGNRLDNLRTIAEMARAAAMAEELPPEDRPATVAFQDNTLILWVLEEPADRSLQQYFLDRYLAEMDRLRAVGVPIAGYLSRSGGRDVASLLRLALCPRGQPDCDSCRQEHRQRKDDPECAPLNGVLDRHLLHGLTEGERSALFRSAGRVLDKYGPHRVYFFYLNIGRELARLEVPEWVAFDAGRLNLAHAVAYHQARNGRGYPTALARAHEQAVVSVQEREQVEGMVANALLRQGLPVDMSEKSRAKQARMI